MQNGNVVTNGAFHVYHLDCDIDPVLLYFMYRITMNDMMFSLTNISRNKNTWYI